MARYYVDVNASIDGQNEVHTSGCNRLPSIRDRIFLGDFLSCRRAVAEARHYYEEVTGCHLCCPLSSSD